MREKPTVRVLTLGCKVNQYESEAIAEAFLRDGFFVRKRGPADVYVINTCTVTAEADRKAGQLIRRAAAENPAGYVIVTGCTAQNAPGAVAAIAGVDDVCGNRDKLSVVAAAKRLLASGKKSAPTLRVTPLDGAPFEPMRITRFDRTRAYVKVEDGCENHCAYCAIAAARGPVRSKPASEAVAEVAGLVAAGCREVVLTGIEIAAWGRDLDGGQNLLDLLFAVCRLPGLDRVRLSSLDPALLRPAFVEKLAALPHIAPHFHLSVQSGSSAVLAAMKRKYNREQLLAAIALLRRYFPEAELTADVIAGFPGETEADFADTLSVVREAAFLHVHAFPYSKRAGTPAATYPDQVPAAVKKARTAALIAAGAEEKIKRLERALSMPRREVLFETYENGFAVGHTASFLEVAAPSPVPLHGQMRTVTLTGRTDTRLLSTVEPETAAKKF